MKIFQPTSQPVDVAEWRRDEEYAQYPEGARDKTLVYSPNPRSYDFLKANHRYLFKRSSHRYPEQFWMEILAYRLGTLMGVPVPATFVAYDSKEKQSGALIEWFYLDPISQSRMRSAQSIAVAQGIKVQKEDPIKPDNFEDYIPGGDFCQQLIRDFDRRKGAQHNFETVMQIFQKFE